MYKMLVVDDENLIRYCLTATFRDPFISLRTAATGSEAVQAILGDSFDLCILDLHLPDMSGIDIMRLIRTTTPATKIIVISGETLTRETRKIVEEGAVLYLDKPFNLEQVRSFVNLLRNQAAGEGPPTDGWRAAVERRRHSRRPSGKLIRYSVVAPSGEATAIGHEAMLRDISDAGMRLLTDHELEPGWRLMVSDGIPVNEGCVRWTAAAQRPGTFHSGVQFGRPDA